MQTLMDFLYLLNLKMPVGRGQRSSHVLPTGERKARLKEGISLKGQLFCDLLVGRVQVILGVGHTRSLLYFPGSFWKGFIKVFTHSRLFKLNYKLLPLNTSCLGYVTFGSVL